MEVRGEVSSSVLRLGARLVASPFERGGLALSGQCSADRAMSIARVCVYMVHSVCRLYVQLYISYIRAI